MCKVSSKLKLQARAAVDNLFGGEETPKPFIRPKDPSPIPPPLPQQVGTLSSDKTNVRLTK